jgi:DNA repair protein RadA/Sms
VRVTEPGADLAIALAVASARLDVTVSPTTIVLGEVGLGGELRQVPQAARRLAEAARLGFDRVVGPLALSAVPGVDVTPVATLREALTTVLGDAQGRGTAISRERAA